MGHLKQSIDIQKSINILLNCAPCRSVECENNSEAWTNLGVLYLTAGESQLANAAFKESQNCDPSYLNGWTGQSLLADAAEGHEEEAMDLFRY